MPPHKPVKTYQRKTRTQMNSSAKSVEAINALFAQNLTQRMKSRRKRKIKLKELPPRTRAYLSNDSIKVDPNNTFDKLVKGGICNPVKLCNMVAINNSEVTSTSLLSPIMTRTRKKISEVHVPPPVEKSSVTSGSDKITNSLVVENEKKHISFPSLSYIKLPKITENEIVNISDSSSKPIFSQTFRERQLVHSSTPCFLAPKKKIVNDSISPITKSDSSTSSKLIEKSYDHIMTWNESFPKEETPKRKSLARKKDTKGRRRKLLANNSKGGDWKLEISPKVYMQQLNLSNSPGFRGFTSEEQSSSWEESSLVQSWINNLSVDYGRAKRKFPSVKYVPRRKSVKTTKRRKSTKLDRRNSHSSEVRELRSVRRVQSNKTRSPQIEERKQRYTTPNKTSKHEGIDVRRETRVRSKPDYRKSNNETSVQKSVPYVRLTRHSQLKSKPVYTESSDEDSVEKSISCVGKNKQSLQTGVTLRRLSRRKSEKVSFDSEKGGQKSRKSSMHHLRSTNEKAKSPKNSRRSTRNTKKFNLNSSSRKSKMKQSTINVTDVTENSLSEKELSYSSRKPKMQQSTVNVTDVTENCSSEKELSYSRSNNVTDVTRNASSKKELSYSRSRSFDFTSDKSTSQQQIDLSNISNDSLTVPLDKFDSFVNSYSQKEQEKSQKESSVITLSDDSVFVSPPTNKAGRNFTVSTPHNKKIIILSNVELTPPTAWQVNHDHSYTCSPLLKPPEVSNNSNIIENSVVGDLQFKKPDLKHIKLKPGKSYRRTLSLLRRSSVAVDEKGACPTDCVCWKCIFQRNCDEFALRKRSSIIVPVKSNIRESILGNYARSSLSYVQGEDLIEDLDESVRSLTLNARNSIGRSLQITARDVVLRRCSQTEVLRFDECYPASALQHCQKIGEGVYGEVFLYRNPNGGTTVMKIIPIEGDQIVNGEKQKKFDEILSEIVIAMELSSLRTNKKNTTNNFSEVQKVRCVQGNYPDRLLDLWNLYDEIKTSENESPEMFPSDQMYIVLELANGGKDLEAFLFNNAAQVYAMFKQTACALAVAESQLKFEHRDLHWGNVLINTVDKNKTLIYRIDGKEVEIESAGIEVAIIDFTLSRIEFDGVVIYNDLSLDNELFSAKGDYQFEIYRLMQKSNTNEWQHFEPYTNILWLHYILDKVTELRYKNTKSKIHKEYMEKLQTLKEDILSFNSAKEFVLDEYF